MTRFGSLFRLRLRHDYHGEALPPITLHVDAATAALAARPDLRLRRGPGFAELAASEDREALRLLAGEDGLVLTFRLFAEAPGLAAVTEGVGAARDAVAVVEAVRRPSGSLTNAATVGAADLRRPGADGLVTEGDLRRRPLAILRLALDPEATGLDYELRFGAVARHWTYHVVGGGREARYSIQDRTGSVAFEALGARRLANGAEAQSFRSAEPIPEAARPPARFALMAEGPFGPRSILDVLPVPRAGPAGRDEAGATGPVSDIYVNL